MKPGERVHLHNGQTVPIGDDMTVPTENARVEVLGVRGFVRGAIVNPDGTFDQDGPGDWHENTITYLGHQAIVRNFVGIASSGSSAQATVTSDLQLARYWGIGNHTGASAASDLSALSVITGSEWGTNSASGANSGNRAAVIDNGGTQGLSGTWTLTQTHAYASSHISNAATLNCLAQYAHSSVSSGGALSIAMFASSTKGTNQALNVTYAFLFST